MAFVLIALVLVTAAFLGTRALMKRSLIARMRNGVLMVQIATAERLEKHYLSRDQPEVAARFAVAVTNALFGNQPSTPEAETFALSHKREIASRLGALVTDQDLRAAVTDAVRVQCTLRFSRARGSFNSQTMFDPLVALQHYGLLADRPEPQPDIFLALAAQYYTANVSS